MARFSTLLNIFSSGELSPLLRARSDTPAYQSGLARCQNYWVLSEGGVRRRTGFRHVEPAKFADKTARVIPFTFSTVQPYMTEWGDRYARFYKDGARITTAGELVTNGDFDTGIAGWTDRSTGSASLAWDAAFQALTLADPSGAGSEAIAEQTVTIPVTGVAHTLRFVVRTGPVTLRIGTTSGGQEMLADTSYAGPSGKGMTAAHEVSLTPGVSPIFVQFRWNAPVSMLGPKTLDSVSLEQDGVSVEVVTPYLESDLRNLQWTQSADVLFLVDGRQPPRTLSRTSHTAWTLAVIDFLDGPYLTLNTTATTLTPSATTGTGITVTASAVTGINQDQGFLATDVGRLIRLLHGTTWGWVKITSWTSPTQVVADVRGTLGGTTATVNWRLGAWSDTTGWPRAITQYEQRVLYGGTPTQPQTFWGSVPEEFTNMAPSAVDGTVTATHALAFTLGSGLIDAILWLKGADKALFIGTVGGELFATGGGIDDALAPDNIRIRPLSIKGSRAIPPISDGSLVLFVSRSGRKVYAFEFDFERETYRPRDLLRRSAHLARAGIIAWTYSTEPEPILYALTADGVILSLTLNPDEAVIGWAPHPVAGTRAGAAVVEDLAVIPNATLAADEVWALVRRTVNGATRRDLERLDPDHEVFLDAHLHYTGPAATVLTGAGHLEGETAQILTAEHGFVGEQVVVGGQVTLTKATTDAALGLGYVSAGKLLPLDGGNPAGTGRGRPKSIVEALLCLDSVREIHVRTSGAGAQEQRVVLTKATDPVGVPPPAITDDVPLTTAGWDKTGVIEWEQREPFGGSILGVALTVVQGEH